MSDYNFFREVVKIEYYSTVSSAAVQTTSSPVLVPTYGRGGGRSAATAEAG